MNCHNGNDRGHGTHEGKEGTGGHGGIGHLLMMVVCCGLPIALFAMIPLLSGIPVLKPFVRYIWLLCPILMIPMMLMMMHTNKHGGHD